MLKLNIVQKTNFHGTVKVQLERKRQCCRLQKMTFVLKLEPSHSNNKEGLRQFESNG